MEEKNYIVEDPCWAKVISLVSESGERVSGEAKLVFVNAHPERGKLRALYAASIDCPQGVKYTSVTLGRSETDAIVSALVQFVGTGETTDVTVTVETEAEDEDGLVSFAAGDNPLCRRLLGCGKSGEITIEYGSCDYPYGVIRRDDLLVDGAGAATLAAADGKLTVTSEGSTGGCELIVSQDGEKILRAVRPTEYNVRSLSGKVGDKYALLLGDETRVADSVYNVRLAGNAMLKVDSHRVCDCVLDVGADGVNLGVEGEIKSDPGEQYLAVVTASYAEVYKADAVKLTRLLRVPRTTEYVEMCRGGALVMWSADTLTVYEPDDEGAYTGFSVNLPRGAGRIVVREGVRYHALYCTGNDFYRYAFARGVPPKLLEHGEMSLPQFALSHCGDAIAILCDTLKVTTTDTDITGEYKKDALGGSAYREYSGQGDYGAVYSQDGVCRLLDAVHGTVTELSGTGYTANGRLVYNGSCLYIFDFYNGHRKVNVPFDLSGASSVCLAGKGIFAVAGGKLHAYYCNGSKLAVRMPSDSAGKTVTATVREKIYKGIGEPVTITVSAR